MKSYAFLLKYTTPVIFLLLFVFFFRYIASLFRTLWYRAETLKSSLTPEQAESKANQLFDLMDDSGTDNSPSIVLILNTLSISDYRKVSQYFGLKPYWKFRKTSGYSWLHSSYDLKTWLSHELTKDDKLKLSIPIF